MGLSRFLFRLADVRCEHCQTKLSLEDFQENETLVCPSCGHSKVVAQRGDAPHIDFDKTLIRPSPSVHIQREGSIFIIEKKWFSRFSKLGLLFALVWNLFWGFGFWALKQGYLGEALLPYSQVLLNVVVLVGLVWVLWALRHSLNSTRIMIKNSKMVVTTSPICWQSIRIYDLNQIEGLSLWRKDGRSGRPSFAFGIDLKLKDGRVVQLCPAVDSNEAAYIEKTLEEILAIEQAPPPVVDPLVS